MRWLVYVGAVWLVLVAVFVVVQVRRSRDSDLMDAVRNWIRDDL